MTRPRLAAPPAAGPHPCAAVACLLPERRAALVDPARAFHLE